MNFKLKICLFFILVYALFCFLSLNRHSSGKTFTYHSEIWADKAGYNVYLPSLFIYSFEANQFPDSIEAFTGYGFSLDSSTNKVITKYPYGVALMQSPFWMIAHLLSSEKDGYSLFYQKSVDFAGSFYLTLGFFFLFFTFRRSYNFKASLLLSLGIILSSGVFYYGIFETGMSHIYSFCCLSAFLFFITDKENHLRNFYYILISVLLYIVIRPVNLLFVIPLFLFLFYNKTISIELIKKITLKKVIFLIPIIVVFFIPQFLYFKYAFGSAITNSYKNEPFYFPTLSRIFELLFSSNNGLLIYYPILTAIIVYYIANKTTFRPLFWVTFLIYIFLYASWWSLSLGCSFGHRAINDIILIFFLPFLINEKKLSRIFIGALIIASVINLKFIFSYDTCLHQTRVWDYSEYKSVLFGEFK